MSVDTRTRMHAGHRHIHISAYTNTNMHTHTKMHVNINLCMYSNSTKYMKIYEYSKTHAFIYSQTCTGTYTPACANAPKKHMRAHHMHMYTCSLSHKCTITHTRTALFMHSLTHSLTHSVIHSLTHSLTRSHIFILFNSHSLFVTIACSYRHTHTCSCTHLCSHIITFIYTD